MKKRYDKLDKKSWPYNLYEKIFGEDNFILPKNPLEVADYVLRLLQEREGEIIFARLKNRRKFNNIALDYGVSNTYICFLYKRAIKKLRSPEFKKYFYNLDEERKIDKKNEKQRKRLKQLLKDKKTSSITPDMLRSVLLRDMPLSVRAYKCLARSGTKTLYDISQMDETGLYMIENMGPVTYEEIRNVCLTYGIELEEFDHNRSAFVRHQAFVRRHMK
jgi:hypothetical protein